jgi:ankyrin repeat protein
LDLALAAGERREADIRALVEMGADIEASFRHGYYHGWTPLVWTAGLPGLVEFLLGRGANPNARGKHIETPLIIAARCASLGSIRALVDAGADPRLADASGQTPASFITSGLFRQAQQNLHPEQDPDETVRKVLTALGVLDDR